MRQREIQKIFHALQQLLTIGILGKCAKTRAKTSAALARANGLTPSALALAYVNTRAFLTSTIIGATSLPQLEENLGAVEVELGRETVAEVEAIHRRMPNPCP